VWRWWLASVEDDVRQVAALIESLATRAAAAHIVEAATTVVSTPVAHGWSCWSGWWESHHPCCYWEGRKWLDKVVVVAVAAAVVGVAMAEQKSFAEERERDVVRPPCEVVERLLVVEVVVEKTLVRVVVAVVGCGMAESERGRERQRRWQKPGKGWFFCLLWTRFPPPLRPWNPSLFIGGGREQSCLHWEKLQPLIQLGRTPTVGSNKASWVVKFARKGWLS